MRHLFADTRQRACLVGLALVGSVLLAGAVVQAAEPGPATAGGDVSGRGFYLGLGVVRHRIDLTFDERATIEGSDIAFETWATGSELVVGYGFGPRFRLEMSVFGAEHAATPDGAEVAVGVVSLSALAPVGHRGAWHPHLIAGLGVTGMPVSAPGFPERAYLMTNGHFGAGLRVDLGRHLFLQGDYHHTIHDLQREYRDVDGDSDLTYVGGDGRSHSVRISLNWRF